jgi:putative cardiolipin synthase
VPAENSSSSARKDREQMRNPAAPFAATIRLLVLLMSLSLLASCASIHPAAVPPSHAIAPVADTPASRYLQSELAQHPGKSGFHLVPRSTDALMSRIVLADHAAHSLDLQYYIFENDATGRLIAQRLLAAADRGVRVRVLVDDVNTGAANDLLLHLAAHPHIEVRLFNPFRTRNPSFVSRTIQFALEGRRLNRRMHNKSFIADGWVAVVGGRNIGDAYFDAAQQNNFRDLDVVAIGPVVSEAARSFDTYWNCEESVPVPALNRKQPKAGAVAEERSDLLHDARAFAQSDYAQAMLDDLPEGSSADRRDGWYWGAAEFLADSPRKVEVHGDHPALRIGPRLREVLDAASTDVKMVSPYFVPGKNGAEYLTALARRGIDVRVLTNSLASTDEPVVHVGYSRYREALLEGGVKLFELRPLPGEPQPATASGTSGGVSLHAKALIVDGRYVFVGSLNMDQRSKLLNTEMGVLIDCPELAHAAGQFFASASAPESAFAVQLDEDKHGLTWHAVDDGKPVTFTSEPGATVKRRAEVAAIRLLPIESLL